MHGSGECLHASPPSANALRSAVAAVAVEHAVERDRLVQPCAAAGSDVDGQQRHAPHTPTLTLAPALHDPAVLHVRPPPAVIGHGKRVVRNPAGLASSVAQRGTRHAGG